MGRKAGATRIKRSKIPRFWKVPRKKLRFIYRVRPGPHPKERAYPLAVLMRDVLNLVKTARDAEAVIKQGKIKVDSVVRREPGFPVGLMDAIGIDATKTYFRILPGDQGDLQALPISAEDVPVKPLAVKRKTTVRKGLTQLGFHDGRTLILPQGKGEVNVGDTVLINVATMELARILPLKKGALALLTKGAYGGSLAKVAKVNPGTITGSPTIELEFDSQTVKVPKDSIFVIGDKAPVIHIPEPAKVSA